MALDTLWAAVWASADVAPVCTGQQLHGRRDCPVRTELHYWRYHRWIHPGLAADCGGVVCTADNIPLDNWQQLKQCEYILRTKS